MVLFRKINLLLLLLLSTTFANAQSSDEVYKGDNDELYYKYNSADGVLEVCAGENPYYGDIDIPSEASITVAGTPMSLPVVGICKEAFKNCTTLSSVHIPSSVTKIGNDAFNGCSKSYTVYFSSIKHVLSIDYGNQYSNPMFTAGITNIGMKILDKIDFNDIEDCDNIKVIKKYAFVKATWLKEVVLGNNVKEIQNKAFYGCDKLESLVIPSVSTIGTNAFDGCTSLSEIKLPSTLTSIGANAFWGCTGLQYIVIPESVNYIYGSAFSGCKNLTDLIISDRNSTLNIAGGAFSSLKYIYSKAQTAPEAYSDAFGGKTDIQLFYKSGVDYNKAPWEDFNKSPIASNTITYYLDGEPYGTPMSLEAGTVIDPKCDKPDYTSINGREVRWGNEPRIMPNEAVVVNGSSKYLLKYVAGETNDQLNKEDVFYFYGDVISDPKELKKDGLTYTITNSILTMPAKDYSLHVEYSLNQAPIGKTGLKFNNADQDLINYVSLKEGSGKITYSTDTKTFSDKIKAKDAGDYTIYYRVEGITPNYCTAFSSLEVPVTIAPRDDKLTFSLETTSYIYDGAAKEPLPIVKYGETTLTKDVNYTVEYANNTNATTDDVKAKAIIKSIPNGNFSIDKELLFTINKADMDLTFIKTPPSVEDAENLIYNGNELPLIKAGVLEETAPDALELLYSQYKDKDFSTIIPKGTNAGSYTVYYRVKGNNNYKDSNPIALDDQVTIAPKAITISPDDIVLNKESNYTYINDKTPIKPKVTSVKYGTEVFEEGVDYTVSYDNNINVGTEAIVNINDVKGGNYIISGCKKFEILPAASIVKTPPTAITTNTYNGTAQVLINKGSSDTGTMEYRLENTTFDADIKNITGINAGDYKVYYRVKGDANHSDFEPEPGYIIATIKARGDKLTFSLETTSYIYDGAAKEPLPIVKYGETTLTKDVNYTVEYANNTNATTDDVKAKAIIKSIPNGNFSIDKELLFTINKADMDLTFIKTPPSVEDAENLIYNGNELPLIKAGVLEETAPDALELLYSQYKDKDFSTIIPKGTNAGSYTVYYRVKGNNNYKDSNPIALDDQVTIAPKELTPNEIEITLSQSGYTYDGNEKKPDVTVKYGEIEFIIDKDYTVSYSNNKDVGTETKQPTVTITDKDGGNYIVNGIKTFTISPAASKVKNAPTAKTNTYNGTDQVLINGGTSDDGKLQYSLSKDEKSFSEKIPTGKNAGDYTVYYRVKGNANHSDSEISQVKVTIASKEITSFNLSQTSYTYDGSEKKPAVTVTYNNTTVPSSEYTVSYTNNKNAGTATVTLTDKTGGNFNVHGTKTFTINKADGSLKQKPAGIENLTYSGVTQNLITAGSSETGTIEYSLDKVNYGTTIPTGKDAKSYTVYYRVKGDANHKDVNTSQFNVTISKAALTISVGNYEMFEGGTMPTFTINYDGLKNGETDAVFTAKPTVSCKATATSKAGDYTITVSGAKADNYNITHVNGKLAILAKVFVSGGDTSKDEDDPATYQITSSEGDSTPTVSITDDKDVSGKFAIPETVGYHNKNYTVTEIGESAFENNKNLTEVVIPSSITGIGNNAFKGCVNLQAITVYNPTPINLSSVGTRGEGTRSDGSIFDGVNKALCILYVPDESVELYKKALVWRDFQHIVPLSTNTTGINGITQTEDEPFDIYNLQGRKVKSKATDLNGLPKGIYIINGKKYAVK